MGTLPGAAVIPRHYGEAMVLYSAEEEVVVVVDGAPPDMYGHEGRKFTIKPGKPTKVPYEAGRFILDHFLYTGVVRVLETETESGVSYDVERAKRESAELLKAEDHSRFMRFVNDAVDDYIKRNKPVPPPSPAMLDIIKRRGYDLKKFGITPIGWEEPEKDARLEQMASEIKALKEMLEDATKPKKEVAHARS